MNDNMEITSKEALGFMNTPGNWQSGSLVSKNTPGNRQSGTLVSKNTPGNRHSGTLVSKKTLGNWQSGALVYTNTPSDWQSGTLDSINTPSDWQSGELVSTNQYMLDNGHCSDIILRTGQAGEPVHAHKFMLVSRSPVFYAMFCGQLAESGREVIIPDIEADVMKLFLRFLYTECVDIGPDSVMGLLYTAKKYSVPSLVKQCGEYLEEEINGDNVCTILEQAHLFDENRLKEQCFATIFSDSNKVLKGPLKDYRSLCYDCLKKVVGSDQLKSSEETIFKACVDWAEEQCRYKHLEVNDENLRRILGDILFLIRFPNMGHRAFTELVSNRDLLNSEEKVAVFQAFHRSPLDGNRAGHSGIRFPAKPRNKTEIFRISRFQEVVGGTFDFWLNDNLCDAIAFMTSRDINLFGVAVFCPFPDGIIRGGVQLFDQSNRCMTRCENLEIVYDPEDKVVDVKFKGSVRIEQGKWYTIMQQMTGSKSFFGTKGQRQVHGEGVVFTFRNSPMYKNNTEIDVGQIPALLYS